MLAKAVLISTSTIAVSSFLRKAPMGKDNKGWMDVPMEVRMDMYLRTASHVTTNFCEIDGLSNFLRYGALLTSLWLHRRSATSEDNEEAKRQRVCGMGGWRDGGTEGRRDGGTEGRRDGGTEGRRDGGTEGWRNRTKDIYILDSKITLLRV